MQLQRGCFSPLAGIRLAESLLLRSSPLEYGGFSPLAGIRLAESHLGIQLLRSTLHVSVPLRGLG